MKFPSGVYKEFYDVDTLRRSITYLIKNNVFKRGDIIIEQGIDPKAYFQYLNNYNHDTKSTSVIYRKGNGDHFGLYRVYANCNGMNAVGSIHFMREIRSALFEPYYYDLDIINAYPQFMYAITKGECLGKYIHERNKCLQEVMDDCNVNRDAAKKLFLMIGFGGNYENWYKDFAPTATPSQFIKDYYNELQQSRETIIKHFNNMIEVDCAITNNRFRKPDGKKHKSKLSHIARTDSYEHNKTDYEIDNAIISRLMQYCEVNVMKMVYQKLEELGISIDRIAYQFDGCMILKEDIQKTGLTLEQFVDCINNFIHQQKFIIDLSEINFSAKPFENTLDLSQYEPCKYNTYEEYIQDQPIYQEFPDEPFSWNFMKSLRNDRQIEYINKYCVYDVDTCEYVLRHDLHSDPITYTENKLKEVLKKYKIDKKFLDNILPAKRVDDVNKPRQWIFTDKRGDRYYNLFMGLLPEIINGAYNEEIGDEFEKFIDTFGIGNDITPLKRIIGHLACRPGINIPKMVCIASDSGFGKDTMINIIRSWYEQNETTNTTIDGLIGNFNDAAGKCIAVLNECHNRDVHTVNMIKDLVTTETIVINRKFESPILKKNHLTLFCFSNTTQGLPIDWESGDRRALFYNLIGQKNKSIASEFMTKYSQHPDFASSCYHRACKWYDPDYNLYRDITTNSKDIMNANNMPDIVYYIYEYALYNRTWTTTALRDELVSISGDEKLNSKSLKRQMVTYFGDNVYKRTHGKTMFNLVNAKQFIEDKWNIAPEYRINDEEEDVKWDSD